MISSAAGRKSMPSAGSDGKQTRKVAVKAGVGSPGMVEVRRGGMGDGARVARAHGRGPPKDGIRPAQK
jgi:hypothetical protein